MTIRSASPEELPAIAALAREAFMAAVAPYYAAEGIRTFLDVSAPEAMLKDEGDRTLVAYDGVELIGMAHIRKGTHLAMLFVAPTRQRRGVGRKLVEAVISICAGPVVTVNSSPNAEQAYLKFGFRRTGDEQEQRGIRFIPMEWRRDGLANGLGGGK